MTDVGTRLGKKLAALDLDEQEAAALVTILGGSVEGEVDGFLLGDDFGYALGPVVREVQAGKWFVVDSFSFR